MKKILYLIPVFLILFSVSVSAQNCIKLDLCKSSSFGDYPLTTSTCPAGYNLISTLGYIYSGQVSNTPLYLCRGSTGFKYHFPATSSCPTGSYLISTLGYIYSSQVPNTPLYLCRHSIGSYFPTTSSCPTDYFLIDTLGYIYSDLTSCENSLTCEAKGGFCSADPIYNTEQIDGTCPSGQTCLKCKLYSIWQPAKQACGCMGDYHCDQTENLVCGVDYVCVPEEITLDCVNIDSCNDYTPFGETVCGEDSCGKNYCSWMGLRGCISYCDLVTNCQDYMINMGVAECDNNICGLGLNCKSTYDMPPQCVEELDCSTINCADYDNDGVTICEENGCCSYNEISGGCIPSDPDALYCSLNDIKHPDLEDCDCGLLGPGEECTSEQLGGITTCTEYDPIYLSGTLSCTDRCEYDTTRCSTQPEAAEQITECSQYPSLIACETDEFHLECYINDLPETPVCESCSLIGECSLYQTLDSCIDNLCNVDPDCDWVGDTESGYCDFVNTFTNDQGEIVDCTGVDWGPCEDGVRRTTGTCTLSDESQEVQEVSCRVTKKFPFFSKSGIIIILFLLIGYYLYTNLEKKKK